MTERRDIGSRLENWAKGYQQMRGSGQVPDRRAFDPADALLLERVMPGLSTLHRSLLWWCYVRQETLEGAAMMLGMTNRPAVQFVAAFGLAQCAVQTLVERNPLPLKG